MDGLQLCTLFFLFFLKRKSFHLPDPKDDTIYLNLLIKSKHIVLLRIQHLRIPNAASTVDAVMVERAEFRCKVRTIISRPAHSSNVAMLAPKLSRSTHNLIWPMLISPKNTSPRCRATWTILPDRGLQEMQSTFPSRQIPCTRLY
jgi:hypothetical protein